MKYREALREAESYLAEQGIADPGTDAWYLMEFCCGMSRTRYFLQMEEEIPEKEYGRYAGLLKRRGAHIPLQHLTGEQEFMGFSFFVNDKVLIPRQDTEILAEEALKTAGPGMRLLDLCTGSGCVLLSLMKLCPGLIGTGSDLSADALEVAAKNAQRLKVCPRLCRSDLFEKIEGVFDLIVSNPPYIPTAGIESLMEEVRLHDPRMALDGGADGLYFYRKIIGTCGFYLKDDGWLMLEIGSEQGAAVSGMMKAQGFEQVRVVKDLAGLDRVVAGRRCAARAG